jgi:hypothetical protein
MYEIFQELDLPKRSDHFSVKKIGDYTSICKTSSGFVGVIFQYEINGRSRKQSIGELKLWLSQNIRTSDGFEGKCNAIILDNTDNETIKVFLQLINELFLSEYGERVTGDILVKKLSAFQKIFTNAQKKQYDSRAIQGCFAEFGIINYLLKYDIDISEYYHTLPDDKFDFSISELDKIEVKSTLKEERIHHFLHTQLTDPLHNITIASVMLRRDDKGLGLIEIMDKVCDSVPQNTKLRDFCDIFISRCDRDALDDLTYSEAYMNERIRFFDASNVPHFDTSEPEGVTHTEYDVDFAQCVDLDFENTMMTKPNGVDD